MYEKRELISEQTQCYRDEHIDREVLEKAMTKNWRSGSRSGSLVGDGQVVNAFAKENGKNKTSSSDKRSVSSGNLPLSALEREIVQNQLNALSDAPIKQVKISLRFC